MGVEILGDLSFRIGDAPVGPTMRPARWARVLSGGPLTKWEIQAIALWELNGRVNTLIDDPSFGTTVMAWPELEQVRSRFNALVAAARTLPPRPSAEQSARWKAALDAWNQYLTTAGVPTVGLAWWR